MDSNNKTMKLRSNHTEPDDLNLFYRAIFEHNPDTVFFLDTEGVIEKPNEGFSDILGYTKEEIVSNSIEHFLEESEVPLYKDCFHKVLSGRVQQLDTIFIHKNKGLLQINLTLIPAKFQGKVIGVGGIAKDITEEKETANELIDTELKFKSLIEEAFVGVYILQNGKLIYGNPRLHSLLGAEDSTSPITFLDYVHPDDHAGMIAVANQLIVGNTGLDHTFRIINKDGSIIDVEAHSKRIYSHNKSTIVGTLQDVTERKKAEELNKYLAYHDPLTELPNRRFFQEKLEENLIISNTLQQKLAVMYLDLDRFKYINDTLGHSIGDKLLQQISKRLNICLGEKNILARLGGDEFSVILPNITREDQINRHALTIIESLEDPFFIEGYKLFITTSIGISIYPNDGQDAQTLMKNADSALYKSKESGKNTYYIYSSSMNIGTYKTFSLELGLRNAIEMNQLEFYYQPKVCAQTFQITGAEALIRWNHPEWGLVSPGEFIPLAEETGLITELGKWVKYTACAQNKAWQRAGLPAIPISINISARRFMEKNLVKNIIQTLEETQLDPKYLEIEITETSVLENEKVVLSTLDELKSIGVRISLDDFGTGYSSLSYLKRFKGRIHTLKIDRSFIKDLNKEDPDNSNFITKTIIELAQHLKMEVVAEGVETEEQLQILKNYNCETIQGYYFSKPVPADEFVQLLQKGKFEILQKSHGEGINTLDGRRRYAGMNLDFPLVASMTLVQIGGRRVELGKTNVLIENIGLEGMRFLSDMRLTVHPNIILEFETKLFHQTIKMYGSVSWMNEVQADIFQYGLEFLVAEKERSELSRLLNQLSAIE
ncbi:EAL domain-containing protein [Bacillus sp. B190/17]|uniref:EAL domain-containing protein n=1 Tax=Bacillus lumedeiriae TaxID=3058829 RepID=A0ABW8I6W4_9BACI